MGAAPLSWLAKIGGDTLKTKAKLLSSAINELYDGGFKKEDIVGLDYIKAATADNLKNKVPEANAVKELNSSLSSGVIDTSNIVDLYNSTYINNGWVSFTAPKNGKIAFNLINKNNTQSTIRFDNGYRNDSNDNLMHGFEFQVFKGVTINFYIENIRLEDNESYFKYFPYKN